MCLREREPATVNFYFKLFPPEGGGVLLYIGYIGMWATKAVLVINRVSILVFSRHFGDK